MAKRNISLLAMALCFLLITSLMCGCCVNPGESNGDEDDNSATRYKLTVQDPNGYLIEDLQDKYEAGEEVIVKTNVLSDGDLVAYLNGVSLGLETQTVEKDGNHWEFYFDMPSHDAVLSFALSEGLTINGFPLEEDKQLEIKTAVYNAYIKDKYEDDISYDTVLEIVSFRCYGVFNDVYVLFVDGMFGASQAIKIDVIAGVRFVYVNGLTMFVYSDGAFYEIYEAYANNILSYDNMLTTQQNYKACAISLYREISNDYPAHEYF